VSRCCSQAIVGTRGTFRPLRDLRRRLRRTRRRRASTSRPGRSPRWLQHSKPRRELPWIFADSVRSRAICNLPARPGCSAWRRRFVRS
jgi:hypothetical protein